MADPTFGEQVRFVPDLSLKPVADECRTCDFCRKDSAVEYTCVRESRRDSSGLQGLKKVDPTWPACVAFRRLKR
jgi:hypothetical protein